jgi:hypothetical protein
MARLLRVKAKEGKGRQRLLSWNKMTKPGFGVNQQMQLNKLLPSAIAAPA